MFNPFFSNEIYIKPLAISDLELGFSLMFHRYVIQNCVRINSLRNFLYYGVL